MTTQDVAPIRNSMATLIAWFSTCLMASGASMLFSDQVRTIWMISGCFGLAAAVAFEAIERGRERRRIHESDRTVQKRFDRELQCVAVESELVSVTRKAVESVLQGNSPCAGQSSRSADRYCCDLKVEVLLRGTALDNNAKDRTTKMTAQLINLSSTGFAMECPGPLEHQQIMLTIQPPKASRVHLLAEILWCDQQLHGGAIVGGRLIRALGEDE